MRLTFIERVLDGLAQIEEADDLVADWHNDNGDARSLQEAFGMSDYEYGHWVAGTRSLKDIINRRRRWEQWLKRKRKDI